MPAGVAIAFSIAICLARMRGHDLQEIESAETRSRELIPEAVIASSPEKPHVAAFDFLWCQGNPIVHVVEIVFVRLREGRGFPPNLLRLIRQMPLIKPLIGFRCRRRLGFRYRRQAAAC
ncbi:MAG: hypothetical protein USCAAHI_00193 [Beijerinckiaceae bacterium]|nr:MAG: hypothetical protein USCAAHI_00193 [Beijerinckiaceae bacterium]